MNEKFSEILKHNRNNTSFINSKILRYYLWYSGNRSCQWQNDGLLKDIQSKFKTSEEALFFQLLIIKGIFNIDIINYYEENNYELIDKFIDDNFELYKTKNRIIFTSQRDKIIDELFANIRNAFAHGGFNKIDRKLILLNTKSNNKVKNKNTMFIQLVNKKNFFDIENIHKSFLELKHIKTNTSILKWIINSFDIYKNIKDDLENIIFLEDFTEYNNHFKGNRDIVFEKYCRKFNLHNKRVVILDYSHTRINKDKEFYEENNIKILYKEDFISYYKLNINMVLKPKEKDKESKDTKAKKQKQPKKTKKEAS